MSEKTHSEALFERYLDSQAVSWERVIEGETKRPDYRVAHACKSCWFEVKEFDDPKPKPPGGFSPCRPLVRKIIRAREKFEDLKTDCCALVLHNCKSIYRDVRPAVVLSAAFGEHASFGPEFNRMLKDEQFPLNFSGSSQLNDKHNTRFSAIIILQHYQVDEVLVEVFSELIERRARGEELGPFAHAELLAARRDQSRRITYPDSLRVIVLENPYARIPFPEDLFKGRFDQRYGHGRDGFSLGWMGSELTLLRGRNRPVPFFFL